MYFFCLHLYGQNLLALLFQHSRQREKVWVSNPSPLNRWWDKDIQFFSLCQIPHIQILFFCLSHFSTSSTFFPIWWDLAFYQFLLFFVNVYPKIYTSCRFWYRENFWTLRTIWLAKQYCNFNIFLFLRIKNFGSWHLITCLFIVC